MEAVVSAFHLDDAIATRGRPREAHRVHRAFGTAVAKAHHLHRKALADFFCQFPFKIVWHTEHRPGAEFFLYSTHDRRMAVPCHQSSKTKVEIDVLVAVDIVNVTALAVAHKNRIWIVSAIVARDAQRQSFRSSLVCATRTRRALLVRRDFLSKSFVHNILHQLLAVAGARP